MGSYRRVPIVALETARLWLRPLALSDAPQIQDQFPHFEVLKYMTASIPWPYPDSGAIEFLSAMIPRIDAREQYHWAIRLKRSSEDGLIGVIGLMPDSDSDNRGFWLARPFWGQGYMKEAVRAVNNFAFNELRMDALILCNAEPNIASHRLKETTGAIETRREIRSYVGGEFTCVIWRLTREAWRANRDR